MKKPNNQIQLESRSLTAKSQLNDALSIFGVVGQFLVRGEFDIQQDGGKLDGGVKSAVEATMINACARIDAILGESNRWTLNQRNALEKEISKSYQASADLFEKQRAIAAEANTPHMKYNPSLLRIRPGMWIAIKGSLENLEGSIVGIGASPREAVECFDACFNGELTPEQLRYIEALNHEAAKNVDTGGNQHSQNSPGSGSLNSEYSEDLGTDSEGSGAGGILPPSEGGYSAGDVPKP